MSIRKNPFITGDYYHVFNRTYQYTPFMDERLSNRALFCLWYLNIPHKLAVSNYLASSQASQAKLFDQLASQPRKNDILAFCLMPNHFHFLLKQNQDGGIVKFIGDFQNTITQYFNTKHKTKGPLFERQFKAVPVCGSESMIYVSRYIHLNPFSANLVHTIDELTNYPYSSLPAYMDLSTDGHNTINTEYLKSLFGDTQQHIEFINNQAEYQKTLRRIAKSLFDH